MIVSDFKDVETVVPQGTEPGLFTAHFIRKRSINQYTGRYNIFC